jgi:hypothetical protein
LAAGGEFTVSRNLNDLLLFPVHTKFSRSWFDERFAADESSAAKLAQKWRGWLRRE